MDGIQRSMAKSGMVRGDDRWMGGVCSGLARKFGIDPGAARLLMVLLILLPGVPLVVYPLLWIAMPDQATAQRLLSIGPGSGYNPGPGYPQDRLP